MKEQFNAPAILATSLLALGVSSEAMAETVDFTDNGNFEAITVEEGNVLVSGSSNVVVTNNVGLTIAGGISSSIFDPDETMIIDFNFGAASRLVSDVSIGDITVFDTSGSGVVSAEATIGTFGENGAFLNSATVIIAPSVSINVSEATATPLMAGFFITMSHNSIQIGSISSQGLDDAPAFACAGFGAPFNKALSLKNRSKRAIPVVMTLTDSDGLNMTDLDIVAAPVVNVVFSSAVSGDGDADDTALDPSSVASPGNALTYNYETQSWEFRLSTKDLSSVGTYTVTVSSGDEDEYNIDTSGGTCEQTFTRQP